MKIIVTLAVLFFASFSFAATTQIETDFLSPFCPTVSLPSGQRASLPNFHEVLAAKSDRARVFRGNSPFTSVHVEELMDLGVGHIIVYKSFSKASDKKLLKNLYADSGFEGEITFLPMEWKKSHGSFDEVKACKLTVQALDIVRHSQVPVFFHCTVGEDRTGVLAGLARVAFDGWSIEKAFQKEMCERGYEGGNPRKFSDSFFVVEAVRENLTPLYLKMAAKLQEGPVTEEDCGHLPSLKQVHLSADDFQCSPISDSEKLCSKN